MERKKPYLAIILRDRSVLVSSNNILGHIAPTGHSRLASVANDGKRPLVGLLGLGIYGDVEHDDVAEVTHSLLRDAQDLGGVLVELDSLDGGGELPGLDTLSGLYLPEANGVVGGTGCGDRARRVDIDGPDGTYVALVGTETLAIMGEPNTDLVILGYGEDEIAIGIVAIGRDHG